MLHVLRGQEQFELLLLSQAKAIVSEASEQMCTTIRDKLFTTLNLPGWQEEPGSASRRGCAPAYANIDPYDIAKAHPATWFSETVLSAPRWSQAKAIVSEAAAPFGFTKTAITSDQPGNYQLTLVDPHGAELSFGADKNIVLALTSGCHLTAEAKQRKALTATPPT